MDLLARLRLVVAATTLGGDLDGALHGHRQGEHDLVGAAGAVADPLGGNVLETVDGVEAERVDRVRGAQLVLVYLGEHVSETRD